MTPSPPRYADSSPIHVGDRVAYNNQLGSIVFVVERGEYSPDFPRDDWAEAERGFMIRFDNGALLQLDEPDDYLRRVV